MEKTNHKVRRSDTDYDTLWKRYIEEEFEEIIAFSLPGLHRAIDFERGVEFMPQ